ncbi:MAG: alpha/beta hydrolase [Dehalococcoidia bacterium]
MSTYTRGDTPLHPQVAELLQVMDAARSMRVLDATAQRAFDDVAAAAFNANVPALRVEEEIAIPGPDGPMRALVFAPKPRNGELRPVVLHLHGGGLVIFKPEATARVSKAIAMAADAVVVSLDYRLAPEHPYPAALDDCVAAYRWLRANAASLGGDPTHVAIAGDSAGGNLAAVTPLRLIEMGEAPPDAVVLISAWLDLTMSSASSRRFGPNDPLIDDAALSFWRGCYMPDASRWAEPLLSPVNAGLSSYPPVCVVVGAIDPFCDEDVQFAEKVRAAGGDAEAHRYDGMPHWFPVFPQTADLTDYADRIGAFLRRVM